MYRKSFSHLAVLLKQCIIYIWYCDAYTSFGTRNPWWKIYFASSNGIEGTVFRDSVDIVKKHFPTAVARGVSSWSGLNSSAARRPLCHRSILASLGTCSRLCQALPSFCCPCSSSWAGIVTTAHGYSANRSLFDIVNIYLWHLHHYLKTQTVFMHWLSPISILETSNVLIPIPYSVTLNATIRWIYPFN